MKKILTAALGLTAFVAFAFQTPTKDIQKTNPTIEDSMLITWDGIEDGQTVNQKSGDFLAETE